MTEALENYVNGIGGGDGVDIEDARAPRSVGRGSVDNRALGESETVTTAA